MKIFNKYKLIASIVYLTSPMYNAYASTPLADIPDSYKLLEHSISLENLSKLFMMAITSGSYEIFHTEPLDVLKNYNNFKPIRNV